MKPAPNAAASTVPARTKDSASPAGAPGTQHAAAHDSSDGPRPPAPTFVREALQILGLATMSAALLAAIFPPAPPLVWLLAFTALVPWGIAVCRAHRAYLVHWTNFLVGWAFFLLALRWLMPVTGLGYSALALYLALYWILAGWAVRTARRHGISPIWSLPIAWVGCEYLRATVMTGFPWLFVAHGLYRQLPLIQISDLVGAYGVSFVALMINGVIIELALQRWGAPGHCTSRRTLTIAIGVTAALLVGTLAYGFYRLNEVDFEHDASRVGPRIAVIQHDFPLRSTFPYGENSWVILSSYLSLAAQAAAEKPDLVVFPETVWEGVQNLKFIASERAAIDDMHAGTWTYGKLCHETVAAFARGDYPAVNRQIARLESALNGPESQRAAARITLPRLPNASGPAVPVLLGSVSIEQFPEETYPKVRRYNSALFYDADGQQREQRYDKRHLVPFGEYVPFRQQHWLGIDLHYWLYRPLNALSPFSVGGKIEYSLSTGTEYTVFDLDTAAGKRRFGVPICYEDTVPYVPRGFTWEGGQRRVDFLVNISNDGWFNHSNELPQHLASCVFRAVENRVGIARSVNTGISAFINPNGGIYAPVTTPDGRMTGPGVVGFQIAPVYTDTRTTLYGRCGDWFAIACAVLTAILWVAAVRERWVLAIKHRIEALFRQPGRAI